MCMHNIRSLPLTGVGPVNIPPSMDLPPAFPPPEAVGESGRTRREVHACAHALHSGRSEEGIADTETREPARRGARTPPACLPRNNTPPHDGPTPKTIIMTRRTITLTSTKHPTKPESIIPHSFNSAYTFKAAGPARVEGTTGGAQGSCACIPRETLLVAGF